jgi:hypothetical protein
VTVNKSILAVTVAMTISGCASTVNYNPPPSVTIMPNDCANKVAMANWLETQARIPRHPMEKESDYEQSRAYFRSRIWHLRYVCQPA